MATAFALVGDRYHTSDYIRTALGRTLVQGMGLSVDFTDEITLLNAQHLSSYRAADRLPRRHDLAQWLRRRGGVYQRAARPSRGISSCAVD